MNLKEMLTEDARLLLEPGYLPVETGYFRLPDGDMQVRCLTRMPRCKGKMLDWWFGHMSVETYQMWEPEHHQSLQWDDKWSPGHYIGASQIAHEYVGTRLMEMKATFLDPSEFFDISKFKAARVGAAICIQFNTNNVPHSYSIFFVRDTDYGCELRQWVRLYHGTDAAASEMMGHGITGMGNLADLLPDLYAKHNPDKKKS